jgi:N-acetylmuramoyl-L-alanine amidase
VTSDRLVRLLLLVTVGLSGGDAFAAAVTYLRVWSSPQGTRVVLELSAPVEHRVFALSNPERIVIDLPASSAAASLERTEARGIVTGVRTGARPGGELRVVLELARAANPKTFLLAPDGQQGHRLVVDLLQSDTAAVVRETPAARDLVIAVDAGHGGQDPGATGRSGVREKDVVLAIARRLAAEIDRQYGMRAVLTRDSDRYVPHRKRMEIAHAAGADLFVSIHADAYRDTSARGGTIYVLNEKGASDEAALRLAQRENASDLVGGVSLADKDQVLARVLLDLSQNAALSASTAAAQRLIRQMSSVTQMRKLQVQQAPFLVLKSPDIPSVLVETAYISNPREEAALRNPQHQATLARALCAGIVEYFSANPPPGSYLALRQPAAPAIPTAVSAEPTARASAPASRPAASASAATSRRHVIARGETLSEIAARYRVSTASLRRTNSLKSDVIRIGQVLKIPPS